MERGGGALEAGGGGADLGEAVLEEVDLQIGLLLDRLQLLHAQLVQVNPAGASHRLGLLQSSTRHRGRRRDGGCKGRGSGEGVAAGAQMGDRKKETEEIC